jgi:hypothetical protein
MATSPSTIWQWYRSICTLRLGAPTASTISCAWSCRLRKKPGMSRVLMGSMSTSRPALAASVGGPAQVVEVHGLHRFALQAFGHEAGHDVDARAVERHGVVDGLGDAFAKLGVAPGQAGQPALAGVPVAGRSVEQHLLQAVVRQPRQDLVLREVVGKQVLHGLEAVFRGGIEAVEKGELRVEHREVGGELGHGVFVLPACAEGAAQFIDLIGVQRCGPGRSA